MLPITMIASLVSEVGQAGFQVCKDTLDVDRDELQEFVGDKAVDTMDALVQSVKDKYGEDTTVATSLAYVITMVMCAATMLALDAAKNDDDGETDDE